MSDSTPGWDVRLVARSIIGPIDAETRPSGVVRMSQSQTEMLTFGEHGGGVMEVVARLGATADR